MKLILTLVAIQCAVFQTSRLRVSLGNNSPPEAEPKAAPKAEAEPVAEQKEAGSPGSAGCQCIGMSDIDGTIILTHGNDTIDNYPPDVGTYCKAWDDELYPDKCDSEDPKDWCKDQWCYVDPCSCTGLENVPKLAHWIKGASHKGLPIYYSYATCGVEDRWTASENEMACVNAMTEEGCGKNEQCSWTGGQCLGWELAGMCDMKKESDMWDDAWGHRKCPCIGISGYNGTMKVTLEDGSEVDYPLATGSACKAWDLQSQNPECMGDKPAENCKQPFCYVDPCDCELDVVPSKSTQLPSATYQTRPVFFSYTTCGVKDEKAGPALEKGLCEEAAAEKVNDTAEVSQEKEDKPDKPEKPKERPKGEDKNQAFEKWVEAPPGDKKFKQYGAVYPKLKNPADSHEQSVGEHKEVKKIVKVQRHEGDNMHSTH